MSATQTENTNHLHSTEYRAMALAADANFWDIIVAAKRPASEGTNPAAYLVCQQEGKSLDRAFVVTMGVVPESGEAFLCGTIYGCSLQQAMDHLTRLVSQDDPLF